jgi:catechol 2,3-dioxygenase-like lactoylglutathione lyase family enzyme
MICHVTVRTPKLSETLEFYQWLLDLPIAARHKYADAEIIFLGENETKFELIEDSKALPINAKGLIVGFTVDNLAEKLSMLDEKKIAHSGILSPGPGLRFAFFTDLNGCSIQLVER